MNRFILIALPGTGKSTLFQECAKLLEKRGIDCNLILTEIVIRNRFNPDDKIIKEFEKENGKISPEIFSAPSPWRAFVDTYGIEKARDIDEKMLLEMIDTYDEKAWLDLGGYASLRESVVKAAEAKKIIPIFLYAEHETILSRLENNAAWKQRPGYVDASKAEAEGWKKLAGVHRDERLGKHINAATIIISVDTLDSKDNQPTQKTPEQLTREIFTRIEELKLVAFNTRSEFSKHAQSFFKSEGQSPSEATKKNADNTLEKDNLNFRKK